MYVLYGWMRVVSAEIYFDRFSVYNNFIVNEGTQLETAVFQKYHVNSQLLMIFVNFCSSCSSPDSDVFEKILQGTEHLADCESVRWRIIMCKTSDVTDSEVQVTLRFLSYTYGSHENMFRLGVM